MNWSVAINVFISILENPSAEKGYKDLKKYYNSIGMVHEADSLEYLIQKKFHDPESTSISSKQ
jgi:hypothetical protein